MAVKPLKRTEDGVFAPPPPIRLNTDGTINVESLVALNLILGGLITHINKGLSLGDGTNGSQMGNLFGQWLSFVTPSSANVEFEMPHGLGVAPFGWIPVFTDGDGVLKASNYGSWNSSRVLFKHGGTSVSMIIGLIARRA